MGNMELIIRRVRAALRREFQENECSQAALNHNATGGAHMEELPLITVELVNPNLELRLGQGSFLFPFLTQTNNSTPFLVMYFWQVSTLPAMILYQIESYIRLCAPFVLFLWKGLLAAGVHLISGCGLAGLLLCCAPVNRGSGPAVVCLFLWLDLPAGSL